MLLVVVVQRAQHCVAKGYRFQLTGKNNPPKGGRAGLTDEGQDDEEDVERDPGVGGDEEVGDGGHLDDEAGDGGRHGELDGEDDVDLADERPPQLGALRHPRVQQRGPAGLEVRVRLPEPEHGR